MKNRKLKYGGMSVTVTVLFIAGIVLFNVLFGLLSDRFYLKADLTETKYYQLSGETEDILAKLPEDVTITVLAREADLLVNPYNITHELLTKYERLSNGKITVEYLDPRLNPTLDRRFPAILLHDRDVVISASRRYINTNLDDMFLWDESDIGASALSVKAEQLLTGSILYALEEKVPGAVYTTGHEETTPDMQQLEAFNAALMTGHYSVGTVDLRAEDFPENATLVVICAPRADFTKEELDKLDRFMKDGRNCLYLSYPGADKLTNLDLYLSEWGIKTELSVVADSENYVSQRFQIVMGLNQNDLTEDLLDYGTRPLAMQISPITRLFSEKDGRRVDPVLISSPKAYAKSWENGDISTWEKENGDKDGPFDIGVLATDTVFDEKGLANYSHVFAVGVSVVFDDYLNTSSYLNGRFLSHLLDTFNPRTTQLYIEPISTMQEPLTLTGGQGNTILWILAGILPVGLWIIGGVIWYRRRHL